MANKTKFVSLGSIKRDGNEFKVKHKVTEAHKKKIDRVYVQWVISSESAKAAKKEVPDNSRAIADYELYIAAENKANKLNKSHDYTKVIDHAKEKKDDGYDSIKITRKSFYPVKLPQVKTVMARAIGRKDGKNVGVWSAWTTFSLAAPSKPSITENFDEDTGHISFTIKTDHPGSGGNECYNTRYKFSRDGNVGADEVYKNTTSTSGSFGTGAQDIKEYTSLLPGQFIKITCTATAQGLAGNSSQSSSSHVFARPRVPVITSAKLAGNKQTGTIVVSFKINDDNGRAPVQKVQLHRLHSEVVTATEAANATNWDDLLEDDGDVKGLSEPAAEATPIEEGTHVWYRVSAKNDALVTYSQPFECKDIYVSKTTTSTGSVSLEVLGSGDGWVKLAVTDTQADDDCVRVSWSNFEDAWISTNEPSSFDVTWLKKKTVNNKQVGYAEVYVRELENGTRYWFKGRAVDTDASGTEVLGGLSKSVEATPSSDSGTVTVFAPTNVGINENLDVNWEFSSDMKQESAEIFVGSKVAASVRGVATKATIPAKLLTPYRGGAASIVARVHAGGNKFDSQAVKVIVAERPTCTISVSTLTAQPLSFDVTTDSPNNPIITANVISRGATGSGLDGDEPQLEGDCVWSGVLRPTWTQAQNGFTARATIPAGRKFWDGSEYTLTVTLSDPVTGIDSSPVSETFDVEWAHQAGTPTGTVVVDKEALTATITVNAPTGGDGGDGYVEGDRFDLYRVTVDGEKRIAEELPFGTTVFDRYAPFGRGANLRYLAVTRTVDGDWANSEDLTYSLPGAALRFDWGRGESVELPFNIEDSASYEKGFEEITALDGTVIGWWDGSSKRSSSLKTDLIKLQSAEQEEAIASMAQHAGPVFVRTPSGAAFSANVVPSSISRSYTNRKVSVSLDCSEVALTAEHLPKSEDIARPQWSGGSVYAISGTVYDSQRWPLDDWSFLGYSGQTLYVTDSTPVVRNGAGTEMTGYTWDGSILLDSNGNEVELTEEAQ